MEMKNTRHEGCVAQLKQFKLLSIELPITLSTIKSEALSHSLIFSRSHSLILLSDVMIIGKAYGQGEPD